MSSGNLILDVSRARAEATNQALSGWQPLANGTRVPADWIEKLAKRLLGLPGELREVVNTVLDNEPRDGTILAYSNRHRIELHALFDSALAELRQALELARASDSTGQKIPSLPELEKALQDAEQIREDTLAHWVEFPEGPIVIDPDDCVPDEEAFRDIEARLSPEARRELQIGMDRSRA